MKECSETKLGDLISKALEVITNRPEAVIDEAVIDGRRCVRAYWHDQRADGAHHAKLYVICGNRRADLGSLTRVWVTLADVLILDFAGERKVPLGEGVDDFCLEFNSDLTGQINGISALLEAARGAHTQELDQLEAMLS